MGGWLFKHIGGPAVSRCVNNLLPTRWPPLPRSALLGPPRPPDTVRIGTPPAPVRGVAAHLSFGGGGGAGTGHGVPVTRRWSGHTSPSPCQVSSLPPAALPIKSHKVDFSFLTRLHSYTTVTCLHNPVSQPSSRSPAPSGPGPRAPSAAPPAPATPAPSPGASPKRPPQAPHSLQSSYHIRRIRLRLSPIRVFWMMSLLVAQKN